MNPNAGIGFCSTTGRYVVLSHPATAAPADFRIPFSSPLNEGRPATFPDRDAAFGAEALMTAFLSAGELVRHCGRLLAPGKHGSSLIEPIPTQ